MRTLLLLCSLFAVAGCAKADCEYNGETFVDGESFPADDGCNTCFCEDGSVGCTEMACAG